MELQPIGHMQPASVTTVDIRIMHIAIYKNAYKKTISNFGGKTMIDGKDVV